MKVTMDAAGRLVVPKAIREALGVPQGGEFDISVYGGGAQLVPNGRTARLVELEDGKHAFDLGEPVDDELMYRLIDEGRR